MPGDPGIRRVWAPWIRRPIAGVRAWGRTAAARRLGLAGLFGCAVLGPGLWWVGAVPLGAVLAPVAAVIGVATVALRLREADAARVAAALDVGPAGAAVTDPDGRLVIATSALGRLIDRFGTPDDAGARFLGVVDGAVADGLARACCADGVAVRDFEVVERDGGAAWLRLEARALTARPAARRLDAILWRLGEVSADHRFLETMTADQATAGDFLDKAPIGVVSVDETGRFVFANRTFARWLGLTPDELIDDGWQLHDCLADPPVPGTAPYLIAPEGGTSQRGEIVLRGASGVQIPADVIHDVTIGPDRRTVRTHTLLTDRRRDRRWRDALRQAEARFHRFFEDAPIGIALVDGDGRIAECNQALLRITGLQVAELLGRPIVSLCLVEDRSRLIAHLDEIAAGDGEIRPLEIQVRGRQALVVQVYARRFASHPDGAGRNTGLILHFLDLTERKNLETQFAQSQKMQAVGQLAGGIAHDFNNLLTAMLGFCDLLLLRHKPGDRSFADLMQIKQNANRAANLIRQLLAFSRQQTLRPQVVDLTDILSELSNLLHRLIGENIELKMVHGRDLGPVQGDRGQLEQVIINLAVNARDAMPRGGRLTIATSNRRLAEPLARDQETVPAGSYTAIEVIDTGVGIPAANLQRIFEPFFSTKEVGSGTGLGLSTVYGIVHQSGGYLLVDSAPGRGATFTVLLPHAPEAPAASDPAPPAAEPKPVPRDRPFTDLTGSETLLLVEDEDPVRVFGARALANKGYRVLEAKSGDEALAQLATVDGAVDLMITDIVMPGMDGPSLIRHVLAERPSLKVICISGYSEDRFRDQLARLGTIHYLPKPFTLKQLATKVKEVLQDTARHRQGAGVDDENIS